MYALLYFFGPGVSVFLTGDPSVLIVWSILAGGSANYIYFWHTKDHLQRIRSQTKLDIENGIRLVRDEGGVQVYVIVLGTAFYLFFIGIFIAALVLFEQVDEGGMSHQ